MKSNPIFCKECSDWGNDTRCENCTSIFYEILMDPLDTCSHFNKKENDVDLLYLEEKKGGQDGKATKV